MISGLQCRECGAAYPVEPAYVCEQCLGPLEAVYDESVAVTREAIAAGPRSLWRYQDLLPVDRDPDSDLHAGFTPLVPAPRLGAALGLRRLYLKNDTTNPTWSFKDRVVALGTAAARRFGFDVLACASTGNLANAVAAAAARAGMRAVVFIPTGLETQKVLTTAVYGPVIVEVEGTYDDVNRLCVQVSDDHRWAFLNVNLRPYYSEGGKTLGFEVVEQLGWRAPDHVVVPVASGSLLVKIHKGLVELQRRGLVAPHPVRVSGAQAEGCAPVAAAFRTGATEVTPVVPTGIAKSLAIGNPADGRYAVRVVRETGGAVEAASDDEIRDAIRLLASTEGIFAESAGGVTVAVLRRLAARGIVGPDEITVAYITGMGIKTLDAAGESRAPVRIRPRMADFEREVLPLVDASSVATH